MFVVQALFPFSSAIMQQSTQQKQQKQNNNQHSQNDKSDQQKYQPQNQFKRPRSKSQQNQLLQTQQKQQKQQITRKKQNEQQKNSSQIVYLTFDKGQRILVNQAYENGWWYGNKLKQPQIKGFFPSNYVQVITKPKPPPPPPSSSQPQQQQAVVFDSNQQNNVDWVKNQLKTINQGPVQSAYYLGIKGYKNVKIDDKNQNILKGDHVKFDVNTGLAKVPIKDQAPTAKAVRQMGYYFDYHQWVQERNKHPNHKSRPDAKRKKPKKLNLKGMN